jgi:hypothetical protein
VLHLLLSIDAPFSEGESPWRGTRGVRRIALRGVSAPARRVEELEAALGCREKAVELGLEVVGFLHREPDDSVGTVSLVAAVRAKAVERD